MNLKVSQYITISLRSYQSLSGPAIKLVLSGRTGSLVQVPLDVAAQLSCGEIPCAFETVSQLKKAQILVERDEDELQTLLTRNSEASTDMSELGFVLVPSSFCNMGCSYCGQVHQKGPVSQEWETAAIKRVKAGIEQPTTRAVDVGWFGGEPMTAYPSILRISATLIDYADDRDVHYSSSITTNGSLLTVSRLIELHQRARINSVEITLDGPAAVHDRRRNLLRGGGSFQQIVRVISEALGNSMLENLRFRLRTNIDVENADYVEGYLREVQRLGLAHQRVTFDLHPVYPWSNDVSKVQMKKEQYATRELDWMVTMLALGLRFVGIPGHPRAVTCAAVTQSMEVISSSGAIFSCTEHVLVPTHEAQDVLASIHDPPEGPRPQGAFDDFGQRVARQEVPCHGCTFLGVCGGACPKHWSEGHIPCPSFKHNIQGRFDIVAVRDRLRIL